LVERWIASPANGVRFSALAPAGEVQWEERGARNAQTAVRIRASAPAGVSQWQSCRTVSGRPGFDSRHWLQVCPPGKHLRRCAGFVNRISRFDSDTRLHSGKALRASNRLITDREMVRFHLPEPDFDVLLRSRLETVPAWSHKPKTCVRVAPPQPFVRWACRSKVGFLVCTEEMRVRFSLGPPILRGS
jgi:hypothetical protein